MPLNDPTLPPIRQSSQPPIDEPYADSGGQQQRPQYSSAGFAQSARQRGLFVLDGSSPTTLQPVPSAVEEANVNYRAIVQQQMTGDRAINLRKFEHDLKKAARTPANPAGSRHHALPARQASQKSDEARYVKVVHKRVATSQSTSHMTSKQKVFSKFSVLKGDETTKQARKDVDAGRADDLDGLAGPAYPTPAPLPALQIAESDASVS